MKRGGARVKEAARWLQQAEFDLQAARGSLAIGRHEWACFQSQQSGEKALKAVLAALGRSGVSSHSLRELLQAVCADRPEFATLEDAAISLDQYYIPTRYPNGLPGSSVPGEYYTNRDSEKCIALCDSILTASRTLVRGSGSSSRS